MQSSEAQYFTYTLARQITNFTEARAHLSTDQLQREGGEVQISIRKLCWRHMHFSGPTRDMKRINGELPLTQMEGNRLVQYFLAKGKGNGQPKSI